MLCSPFATSTKPLVNSPALIAVVPITGLPANFIAPPTVEPPGILLTKSTTLPKALFSVAYLDIPLGTTLPKKPTPKCPS